METKRIEGLQQLGWVHCMIQELYCRRALRRLEVVGRPVEDTAVVVVVEVVEAVEVVGQVVAGVHDEVLVASF